MDSNTINRVVISGTVSGKPIKQEKIIGGQRRILANMVVKQADLRKKEEADKKKVNLFLVRAVGDAAKAILGLVPDQPVIVRGMIQARVKKEDENNPSPNKILPYIFVPDADGIQHVDGFVLVNEATVFGKIYTSRNIQTKIHIKEEDNYAHVAFVLQVGNTKKNENPFAETEPINLVFVKYRPKNIEGFKVIKDRFYDKGRFVAVTGALISETFLDTQRKKQVYRLELVARQLVAMPGHFVKIKEVNLNNLTKEVVR